RVFVESNGRAFMNVFEPSNSRVASHFTVLRILDLFRTKYGQTGLLRSSDFVSVATIHAEFQDQGTTLSELGFYLKRMAEFGLLMPQGLEASHGFGSEPFALTKCGLYYLERLYKNPTYFSLMAHDTTLFDQTTCERCSELLKRFSGEPKLPLVTRNEIAGCFLKYLDQKENTERNGGVVGRHAVFGAVTFVPPMEVALERVVRMAN
ncbi:MAG: hypothetical protein Q8K82_22815, partial [Gemmatimonadaceae bacterium]|nr:hypothetical protein [Gemmatimonadaceae bacterium]